MQPTKRQEPAFDVDDGLEFAALTVLMALVYLGAAALDVQDSIAEHTTREFHPDNGYKYFCGDILQDYQRQYGKIEGLYYDPRGRPPACMV